MFTISLMTLHGNLLSLLYLCFTKLLSEYYNTKIYYFTELQPQLQDHYRAGYPTTVVLNCRSCYNA